MPIETERKFTVTGVFPKDAGTAKQITQGYICADPGRTVRIRIAGDDAFITIKGPSDEKLWSRYEFERQIPLADGLELMKLCTCGVVSKVRYLVPAGKHVWEVDVFQGDNEGLVIAEIELESEQETVEIPCWAGAEVTADRRYYNAMLSKKPYNRWKENL
jgi:CYTH domain-containing protein